MTSEIREVGSGSEGRDESARSLAPLWATLVATFLGVGRMKAGPGTWGSLATVGAWALLSRFLPGAWVGPSNIGLPALPVRAGIAAATPAARGSGLEQPQA